MIKFIKKEWFKLGILTLAGICTFSIISIDSNAVEKKNTFSKSQIKSDLEKFSNMSPEPSIGKIEYLKLEQMEKLNKNLENIDKKLGTIKDTIYYK